MHISCQGIVTAPSAKVQHAANGLPSKAFFLPLPSLACELGSPHAGKQVLAFIFVLRIKFQLAFSVAGTGSIDQSPQVSWWEWDHFIVFLHMGSVVFFILPGHARSDSFRLQDEFPHFVLLTLFTRLDIFPAQDTPADGTTNIAHDMLSGDKISGDGLVLERVGQRGRHGVDMARRSLHQVRAAVSAHEAFAYDLRGEAKVSGAFRALDVGAVAIEEFIVRRDYD